MYFPQVADMTKLPYLWRNRAVIRSYTWNYSELKKHDGYTTSLLSSNQLAPVPNESIPEGKMMESEVSRIGTSNDLWRRGSGYTGKQI
jgi:hypothetical protein